MHAGPIGTTALAAAALAATAWLSACGSPGGTGSSGSSTTNGSSALPSETVTMTVTMTVSATHTTLPGPPLSRPGKPNGTMSTPPPAKDPLVIPGNPQAYAQAFVTAWLDGDRARAARLGTDSAVTAAFASTVTTAPTFQRCEGAAGSSYCTWQGHEYTMTVRVGNEMVAQRQARAVQEVRFAH